MPAQEKFPQGSPELEALLAQALAADMQQAPRGLSDMLDLDPTAGPRPGAPPPASSPSVLQGGGDKLRELLQAIAGQAPAPVQVLTGQALPRARDHQRPRADIGDVSRINVPGDPNLEPSVMDSWGTRAAKGVGRLTQSSDPLAAGSRERMAPEDRATLDSFMGKPAADTPTMGGASLGDRVSSWLREQAGTAAKNPAVQATDALGMTNVQGYADAEPRDEWGYGQLDSFPKDFGLELDAIRKQIGIDFPGKKSKVQTGISNVIRERYPDPVESRRLIDQYFGKPLPDFEGVPFSERKPIRETFAKHADGGAEFTEWSKQRLAKAREVGGTKSSEWGDPTYLGRMVNGDLEDGILMTRILGALSPSTPTQNNALQALEVFVRIKRGEDPKKVLKRMKTIGVMNQGSKVPNLRRAQMGGRIYRDKAESLASNEFGVSEDVPIDLWLLRAIGAETEKTPPKLLYKDLVSAMRREADALGEDPFEYMAKVWTGTQHIAGRPTPSFSEAFGMLNLPGPVNDPEVMDWIMRNARRLPERITKDYTPSRRDLAQRALGTYKDFDPAAFKAGGQQRILADRQRGDLLKDILKKEKQARKDKKAAAAAAAAAGFSVAAIQQAQQELDAEGAPES